MTDATARNVLHVAREAGFVASHYHGGANGTTQMFHENGNMLLIVFADRRFHAATGYGWGAAPWVDRTWSTADFNEFTARLAHHTKEAT
jgi:hypothetical protein